VSELIDDLDWEELVMGLRNGDAQICTAFWRRYGGMLEQVAQKQLSSRVQRRVGSDDVVQSACRTFFRRVTDGQFDLPNSGALWRLLCAITVTKARRAARDQSRKKRGLQQETSLVAQDASGESRTLDLPAGGASPLEEAEVADQLEALLALLSPEECQVLDLKLQKYSSSEIAQELGCSERTVRRLVNNIQHHWTRSVE